MGVSDIAKMRTLEDENRRLKKLLADSALEIDALKLMAKPTQSLFGRYVQPQNDLGTNTLMPPATPPTATAEAFVPAVRTLAAMRAAAQGCRGCELYRHATQTVFGAGRARALLFFVGEQPGDQEDRAGEPLGASPIPEAL